ncbi:hypothetical protein [Gallibacter intestinalis]|uniref:C2H2-type domain-containing protein n=1 Tax=Gallibacter intestinalis TaxID=2779356 RepID=A0ABR9QYP4_9FIRM|nr:hypothetical protein [Gallibacter intestinalis]MBE5035695.1 hypothetical protein [Gallibacter intestinalis]
MPNTGRITVCPYYRGHKEQTITCEDCIHFFGKKEIHDRYMDEHCDKDWQTCKWAKDWEKHLGDPNHRWNAAMKELKKLIAHQGRQAKKIRKLARQNKVLETILLRDREKLARQDKGLKEYGELFSLMEARVSYMAHIAGVKEIDEAEFKKWCKQYEYAQEPIVKAGKFAGIRFHEKVGEKEKRE